MITTALVIGLLASSASGVRANSKDKNDHKDKGHKFIGLSPVDFPHKGHGDMDGSKKHHGDNDCQRHDDCGQDNCGHHHCGNDSCNNTTKPTQENPGGSKNGPPGTPENPTKPYPPKTPIRFPPSAYKFLGNKNLVSNPMKGLHDPLRPSPKPAPPAGTIPTLGTGVNGFANGVGKDVGSAVGLGVSEAIKGVGSVANAVGDLAGGVASAASDLGSAVENAIGSIL